MPTRDKVPTAQPPLVVFVHIPKTAGTTLSAVLRLNESGTRNRRVGNVFKGGSGGAKTGAEYARLRKEGWLDGVRLISGHFPLSVRDHLPTDRELRFCTILREPVDRTISHYFNIRQTAARRSGKKGWALPPLQEGATIEAAVEGGYLYDNLQTRMLAGVADPFGPATEEMLERAKHNLAEELVSFGLAERFDESLLLAGRRLGLRTILGPMPARVNQARPRGDDIPPEMRRAAEASNEYDLELYRYAEELFDQAPELAELEFQIGLAALAAARATGDIEVSVPPPAEYDGGERSWRLLVQATAHSMRQARELVGASAMAHEMLQDLDPQWNGAATRDISEMLHSLAAAVRAQTAKHRDPDETEAQQRRRGGKADGRKRRARRAAAGG
jgi:hypothetical protein